MGSDPRHPILHGDDPRGPAATDGRSGDRALFAELWPLAAKGSAQAAGRGPETVHATAWPAGRRGGHVVYQCRVWDAHWASEPFFVMAPRGFLSGPPAAILARFAQASDDAFGILRKAVIRGAAVELNQTPVPADVVLEAMVGAAADDAGADERR